jgi:hypothetical protein
MVNRYSNVDCLLVYSTVVSTKAGGIPRKKMHMPFKARQGFIGRCPVDNADTFERSIWRVLSAF